MVREWYVRYFKHTKPYAQKGSLLYATARFASTVAVYLASIFERLFNCAVLDGHEK